MEQQVAQAALPCWLTNMIVNVFCRCGCGEQTGYLNLPPGRRLRDCLLGVITGHTPPARGIIDYEMQSKMAAAALAINLTGKYVADKYGRIRKV